MKYSEFENFINGLGDDYTWYKGEDGGVFVTYKGEKALHIGTHYPFVLNNYSFFVKDCPKKSKIGNMTSILAGTPLNEREEENKYNVIIGNNSTDTTDFPLIAWAKSAKDEYYVECCCQEELKEADRTFTESEYQELLEYIKTLPNANKQLKIAEIGKTIAEV